MRSPSAERNRDAIADAFAAVLPLSARVLEVGSGTGEHAIAVTAARPDLTWRPSDPDPAARASVAAWTAHENRVQISEPLNIDARADEWGVESDAPFDAVVSANMIHIAPWEAALGLLAGAGRLLRAGGVLVLYGPFARGGAHTAPSNADFDASLKMRDPSWGVRDLDDVAREADARELSLLNAIEMPANNLTAVFVRR